MQTRDYAHHGKERLTVMISAALELLNARTWSALARLTTLALLLALPLPTQAEEAAADAPTAPAAPQSVVPAPTQVPTQAPMAGLGEPTQNFGPTASRDWVDRLTTARRHVRATSAASDDANEAYARALFQKVPEGPELAALRTRREQARKDYTEAMAAVPHLVGQARDAGVSPKVLKLYENSMP